MQNLSPPTASSGASAAGPTTVDGHETDPPPPQLDPAAPEQDAATLIGDVGALMRIQAMLHSVSDEVSPENLDATAAQRLHALHESVRADLNSVLGEELQVELGRYLAPSTGTEPPSRSTVALTHAQMRGWLDGLVSSMQMTARAALQHQIAQTNAAPARPSASTSDVDSRAYL